eukprot:g537.t1
MASLDLDIQAKSAAKYDKKLERDVQEWIEAVTGELFESGDSFAANLKSGVRLCKLLNAFEPGVIKRISASKMPFKQMENIFLFLQTARQRLSLESRELFSTPDLYEEKNLDVVLTALRAVSREARRVYRGHPGPWLSLDDTDTAGVPRNEYIDATAAAAPAAAHSATTASRRPPPPLESLGVARSLSKTASRPADSFPVLPSPGPRREASATKPQSPAALAGLAKGAAPEWYFLDSDGAVQGPYDQDVVLTWFSDGVLTEEHQLARSGEDWVSPSRALEHLITTDDQQQRCWYLLGADGESTEGPFTARDALAQASTPETLVSCGDDWMPAGEALGRAEAGAEGALAAAASAADGCSGGDGDEWYVCDDSGEVLGPHTESGVRQLMRSRQIHSDSLVSRGEDWVPAHSAGIAFTPTAAAGASGNDPGFGSSGGPSSLVVSSSDTTSSTVPSHSFDHLVRPMDRATGMLLKRSSGRRWFGVRAWQKRFFRVVQNQRGRRDSSQPSRTRSSQVPVNPANTLATLRYYSSEAEDARPKGIVSLDATVTCQEGRPGAPDAGAYFFFLARDGDVLIELRASSASERAEWINAITDALDREIRAKADAKYDMGLERAVQSWIEAVTGIRFRDTFAAALKDGVLLCKLLNHFEPNMVKKVSVSNMPFKQMENIFKFLTAAREQLGVESRELFSTPDLYEEKNMSVVLQGLSATSRALQRRFPTSGGPFLDVLHDTGSSAKDEYY